jgi:hypothetical protein
MHSAHNSPRAHLAVAGGETELRILAMWTANQPSNGTTPEGNARQCDSARQDVIW